MIGGNHLRITKNVANTIHSFTGGGWNTDQFVLEYEMTTKAMAASNRQKKIGALAQKEGEGTLFTHTHHGEISEEVAGTLTSTGLMKQQIMIKESGNSNMSRAESMVFEEQPDGGLRAKSEAKVLTRKDGIAFKKLPDGNIRGYRAGTEDKRGAAEYRIGTEDTSASYEQTTCGQLSYLHGGRIRKLTAKECFRLMDVDEANIDKIQAAGISETQQYKMAGNSIVVNVLAEIFRKLFVDEAPEEGQQLLLF